MLDYRKVTYRMYLLTYIQYVLCMLRQWKASLFPAHRTILCWATLPEDQYPSRSILICGLVSLNLLRELLLDFAASVRYE